MCMCDSCWTVRLTVVCQACTRYVAKTSMRQGTNLARNIAEMEEDVNAHMTTQQYAQEFNKALVKTGGATQTVTYLPVNLVLHEAGRSVPGPQTAMFLEPYLEGRCAPSCFYTNCLLLLFSMAIQNQNGIRVDSLD